MKRKNGRRERERERGRGDGGRSSIVRDTQRQSANVCKKKSMCEKT